MFKKFLSIAVIILLIFSAASCGKKGKGYQMSSEITEPEKKIVIMVTPQDQYKEEYFAAQRLSFEYPDSVIVQYCNDSRNLKAGNPDILDYSVKYARDNSVGAIIYDRATQFTEVSIGAAKAENPDLVTVVIEPEGNVQSLCQKTNLIFSADWEKCAADMVSTAKEMNAEYFVMFSFDRHMKNDNYVMIRNCLEKSCKENGIKFLYENTFDTNNAGGTAKAEQCIQESVARLGLNEKISGKNAVLFSTDSSVQKVLVSLAANNGYMYICPSFPTAYDGIGEVYSDINADECKDINLYIDSLEKAIKEKNVTGKLAIYTNPLAERLLKAAVYCTFDILNKTAITSEMNDSVPARLRDAFEDGELEVSFRESYGNLYQIYLPGFKILTQ